MEVTPPSPVTRTVSESSTCLETIHILHRWRIESFSVHAELSNVGDALTSPTFGASDGQYTFALKVFPTGKDEECRGYVSLFLQIKECPTPKARFRVKFFVETTEGPRDCALNRNIVTINKGGIVTASRFFSVEFLRQRAARFLPQDTMVVGCELFVFGETHSEIKNTSNKPYDAIPRSTLSEDFGRVLRDQRHTDCRFHVGKTIIRAHRAVLAGRSPVFAAMFEHKNMTEAKEGNVEINDVAPEILDALMEFIYTDSVANLADMADEVMIAAEKYSLDRLKAKCEVILCEDINVDNVCSRLKIADMHSAHVLKEKALKFFRENTNEVVATAGWAELEQELPRLSTQVLKGALVVPSTSTSGEPPAKRMRSY